MNQQQQPQYRRSKWLHPSLGILNLPIAAIAISIMLIRLVFRGFAAIKGAVYRFAIVLIRYVFRGLVAINGSVYRIACRIEQWAIK